jgi:hypothetical protein
MPNNAVEDGWQRFLERLRQLWGKQRDGQFPKPFVTAAAACFTAAPGRDRP